MSWNLQKYSREIICLIGKGWAIMSISDNVSHVLGHNPQHLLGHDFLLLVYPSDRRKCSIFKNKIEHINSYAEEISIRIKNSTGKYVWFKAGFRKNEEENPGSDTVVVNCFPLVENNKKGGNFFEIEENYELLTQQTGDILSFHDLQGNYLYVSPSVKKILGYSPSELLGKSKYDYMHPDDVKAVKIASSQLNILGHSSQYEWRGVKKDGSLAWLDTHCTTILDESGNPKSALCYSREITGKKEAEEKLRESQQWYQSLFNNNPEAIFSVDLYGRFTDVNDAAANLVQCRKEDLIGSSYQQFTSLSERKKAISLFLKAKKGISKNVRLEVFSITGHQLIIDLTYSPVKVGGKIVGIIGVAKDITQISRLQKEKDLILNISKSIDDAPSLKQGLNTALKLICTSTNSSLTEIWMPGASKRYIKLENYYFNEGRGFEGFIKAAELIKVKLGDGLEGITWKPGWYENILKLLYFKRKSIAEGIGLQSCIAVPVTYNDECIAVISFYFDYPQFENQYYKESLKNIAAHLGSELTKRKSAEELNLLFDISSDLLCLASFDGSFKKLNHSFSLVLGYEEEDFVDKALTDFIHPDDVEITRMEVESMENGEEAAYFENRLRCRDGSYKWFEWRAQALPGEEAFFGIGRDISFQKSKEEELLRIKLAVEATSDAIAITDESGLPIYHNKAYLKLLGYTPQELKYIGLSSIYQDPRIFRKMKRKLSKGLSFQGDAQLIGKNKEVIDFFLRATPVNNSKSEFIGFLLTFTDLRERIKMERKVQQEKAFAESTINALPGIFYIIDKNYRFVRWNKNFENVTGYSFEEFKKLKPLTLFGEESEELIYRKIDEVFEKGKAQVEASLITRSGKKIPYFFTGTLTSLNAEKYLLGFGLDISERKMAEHQLQEAHEALAKRAEELVASNEELENFAYIASHDLQEPLRMITGFLQLLEKKYEGLLDEEGGQFIKYAIDGGERMRQLILDLLEYSRVGTSMQEITDVDLNEIVRDLQAVFKDKISEGNVSLRHPVLPVIKGVKIQIMQLFQNLIGNAIKYRGKNDPVITIQFKEKPGEWLFSIEDNGIGIKEKFYERIFVIFQRLHNRKEYSGTGIGLAICKKIVERHGGKIWVESVEGKGSTFFFTLYK